MAIHSTAIVEDGADIHPDAEVGPYCMVGPNVSLSEGVRLQSHVSVNGHTAIGKNTIVHPFAVLGAPPQHLGYKDEPTTLVIGENNIIREHATMHTGTQQGRGTTIVGNNCLFMVGAHVAHDCTVGNNVIFANNATLGGHIDIGDYVFLGGLSALHQFCRVGPYAFLGGGGILTTDIIPYGSAFGNHAKLEGLNIVGMRRRGLPRETIHKIRSAYRMLFAEEGTLSERLADAAEVFKDVPEVMTIVEFMTVDAERPLCLPAK